MAENIIKLHFQTCTFENGAVQLKVPGHPAFFRRIAKNVTKSQLIDHLELIKEEAECLEESGYIYAEVLNGRKVPGFDNLIKNYSKINFEHSRSCEEWEATNWELR